MSFIVLIEYKRPKDSHPHLASSCQGSDTTCMWKYCGSTFRRVKDIVYSSVMGFIRTAFAMARLDHSRSSRPFKLFKTISTRQILFDGSFCHLISRNG